MKKILMAVVAVAVVALAGSAMAADSATVAVSASVAGNCKFLSGGSVSFALDPSSGADASGVVLQPTFWCTKGSTYTISDDYGINEASPGVLPRRMKHASLTEYIPYSLTYTNTGTGGGRGVTITMNLASTVLNVDFVNASAGSYADTVTLSITP